jgi:uncharacterized protein (DUF1330 family)|tara:strand:- start:240 stop:527 length:288 start_codon:yes stop_codon:yes gene_type:complete
MKGYVICVYESIKDDKALKNYALKARESVERYNGKFLVRGGKKITTEGNDFVRTVVIEFSSFDQAKKFFYSTEYQAAHGLLKDTVVRHHQIIEGS